MMKFFYFFVQKLETISSLESNKIMILYFNLLIVNQNKKKKKISFFPFVSVVMHVIAKFITHIDM